MENNQKENLRFEFSQLEFSQKVTFISSMFSMGVVLLVIIANFILLWFGKTSMPQETITTITVYGGITSTMTFGGYCALTLGRNCSLNKLQAAKLVQDSDSEKEH